MNRNIIFLLPYAGGSSISYLDWKNYLKDSLVYALDYPGHGLRLKDKLCENIDEISEDISKQIYDVMSKHLNQNFLIFGHSMGGLVTWHATKILVGKYKLKPKKICISACSSPSEFHKNIHLKLIGETEEKKEKYLLEQLMENKNLSYKIVSSKYFIEKVFPIVKKDYEIINKYIGKIEEKIDIPIDLFYGDSDYLFKEEQILKWKNLTIKEFKVFKFNGNHFYLEKKENKEKICEILKIEK